LNANSANRAVVISTSVRMVVIELRPNGPELSCGGEQPPQRNPVRAS